MVQLECLHELWFYPSMCPKQGEQVWCKSCGEYVYVGPPHAIGAEIMHADGWVSVRNRVGRGYMFTGMCHYDTGCGHVETSRDWHKLEQLIHRHQVAKHGSGRFASILSTIHETPLPKGSEAPF